MVKHGVQTDFRRTQPLGLCETCFYGIISSACRCTIADIRTECRPQMSMRRARHNLTKEEVMKLMYGIRPVVIVSWGPAMLKEWGTATIKEEKMQFVSEGFRD